MVGAASILAMVMIMIMIASIKIIVETTKCRSECVNKSLPVFATPTLEDETPKDANQQTCKNSPTVMMSVGALIMTKRKPSICHHGIGYMRQKPVREHF